MEVTFATDSTNSFGAYIGESLIIHIELNHTGQEVAIIIMTP